MNIRLNQVLRQEKKFLLTLAEAAKQKAYLDCVMIADEHGGAEGYTVRSLYFDSLYDRDAQEKEDGLELRRKLRLRIYSPRDDFAMLEMKQKEGPRQKKRSLRLNRLDAQELCRGNYRPLLNYREEFSAECYAMMNMYCYRPKTVVEYRRKAFIAKENRIRITFDSKVEATECCMDLFSDKLNLYPVWDPFHVILEVKYDGFLLGYLREWMNRCDKSELSISKYEMARGIREGAIR